MRGGYTQKLIDVFCVLLDCSEHRTYEFRHLGLHPKTIGRLLNAWAKTHFVMKRKTPFGYSYRLIPPLPIIPPDRSTKICTGCHHRQSIKNFNRNKGVPDGHQNYCRICQQKEEKAYYEANKERLKAEKRIRMARYRARKRINQTHGVNQ